MKKLNYALASGALISLLAAGPVLAHDGSDKDHHGLNLGLGAVVSALAHDKDKGDGNFGATVRFLAHSKDRHDGDDDRNHATSTKERILARFNAIGAGIVSSVSASGFTFTPFGGSGTTTVTTNASTTFKVDGAATTSSAVTVGSRVIAVGTTSTSTPDSIAAKFVIILNNGFAFLKHFFVR